MSDNATELLVVQQSFGSYLRGDRITDAATVAGVLASSDRNKVALVRLPKEKTEAAASKPAAPVATPAPTAGAAAKANPPAAETPSASELATAVQLGVAAAEAALHKD